MKKTLALVLALVMLLAMGSFASAEEPAYNPDAIIYQSTSDDPTHLDPALCSDGQSTGITGQVFSSLMTFDLDRNLVCDVAESYEVTDDGTTYTFKIRDGVKFHDGTPCDAYAVEWNYNRVCPCAEGDTEAMPYASLIYGGVTGFEATDASTFVVHLDKANSAFLTMSTAAALCPGLVSPTAYEADPEGFDKNPVGCGPYKFVEWVPGQYTRLERYDDYHGGKVENGGIVMRVIGETSTVAAEVMSGGLDFMDNPPAEQLEMLKQQDNLGYLYWSGMTLSIFSFADYEKNPLFSDIRLRQAVCYALDVDSIVSALYGENMIPAVSAIPPVMQAGDRDYTTIGYDPEKAKELMAEAGYPDGFEFTVLTYNVTKSYNPAGEQLAIQMAGELEKVGIKMHIMIKSWADFQSAIYTDPIPEGDEHYDALLHGWGADYDDTSNVLFLFSDDEVGTGLNHSGYASPEFNQYFDAAVAATSFEEAGENYYKAAQLLNDDVPVYILAHGIETKIYSKKVINGDVVFNNGGKLWMAKKVD